VARDHLFNVRFDDDEQRRLDWLTKRLNLTAASLIRMLIVERYRKEGGEK
jgi:predicted DNA-binding protein